MTITKPDLQLYLEGQPAAEGTERVLVKDLSRAAGLLADLLTQLWRDAHPAGGDIEWEIASVQNGSVGVDFDARSRTEAIANQGRATFVQTLDILSYFERGGQAPVRAEPHLSYPAVDHIRQLGVLASRMNGSLAIRGSGQMVQMTGMSARRAKVLLDRRYRSLGSVEGRLETVSVHGQKPWFTLYHALNDYAIRCDCSEDVMMEIRNHLSARIRVTGELLRRFDGHVVSLDIQGYQVLPRDADLPSIRDLEGILQDPSPGRSGLPSDPSKEQGLSGW